MARPRIPHVVLVVGLLLVALVLRVVAAVGWQDRLGEGLFFGDSASYLHLAQALAAGEPYQFRSPEAQVFRTPGYPLLLAVWLQLAGDTPSLLWARGLSVVLGALAVGLTYVVGRMAFTPKTGLWAGAVAAVHPELIGQSVFLLSEAAFTPAALAQVACLIACQRATAARGGWGWALAAGLLGGWATLVRPSWLLFTPAIALLAVASPLLGRRSRTERVAIAGVLVTACMVVLVPWWVRNWVAVGTWVPTTLQVGASLYDGLSPSATGASDMRFVDDFQQQVRRQHPEATPAEFELLLDATLRQAAWDWASAHPDQALRLAAIKFVRMWNIVPNEPGLRAGWLRWIVAVGIVPVLGLAVWAIWRFRHDWALVALLWLPAVYVTGLHVVFVSSIRYRQPVLPLLIVLAVAVLTARPSGKEEPS